MAEYEIDDLIDENLTISNEGIQEDVFTLLRNKLGNEDWSALKVDTWVEDIIGGILKELAEHKNPFKYVVNCTIMQRTGAAMASGFASLWDNTKDGIVHVPFENDSLICTVTVYFLKLN
ncbi:unnamed protein product [Phytomonas sp. Hart1]|nr:unnamed protein product [Phytomonas sp. Hart1]|eukprot:CCW66778.1 unnamed protein product [Phytomonas sp. isolate Hart1]